MNYLICFIWPIADYFAALNEYLVDIIIDEFKEPRLENMIHVSAHIFIWISTMFPVLVNMYSVTLHHALRTYRQNYMWPPNAH